ACEPAVTGRFATQTSQGWLTTQGGPAVDPGWHLPEATSPVYQPVPCRPAPEQSSDLQRCSFSVWLPCLRVALAGYIAGHGVDHLPEWRLARPRLEPSLPAWCGALVLL